MILSQSYRREFEAWLLHRGALPRLRQAVDHFHDLCGPIPAVLGTGGRRRDLGFCRRVGDVRSGASAPPLRLCKRFKLANSLAKAPFPSSHTLTCPEPATPPCRGGHQTSLRHGHRELPDYIDCSHTAANHTLPATLVQGQGP